MTLAVDAVICLTDDEFDDTHHHLPMFALFIRFLCHLTLPLMLFVKITPTFLHLHYS